MLKKLLLVIATLIATMGFAFAQVDVNKADQAALDGVKGIGPSISKKIIDERKKGGDFKDWADFEKRVKGIGEKNSTKLSQAGLVVNGQSKANAPATATKETKAAAKAGKADVAPAAPAPAASAPVTASAPAAANKEDKKESKADKKNKKAEAAPAAASASASAGQEDKKESKADKKKKKAEKAATNSSAPAADKK